MNKQKVVKILTGIMITSTMISAAWAQQRTGKGMKQMYTRNYDVNTVETIQGEVMEVSYEPGKRNAAMVGVHMVLKTESETVPVHLGPVWYVSQQDSLNAGDMIEVTGSRITFNGAPAFIAATVKRNGMTLRLREQNGLPVWRGWRKGGLVKNR